MLDDDDDEQMDVEEQEVEDEIQAIPIYDQYVVKPSLPLVDDRVYVPVKARCVKRKNLVVGNTYLITLIKSYGRTRSVYIRLDSIGVPDEPSPDGGVSEVVTVRQYIPRRSIHSEASPDEFLLVCHPQPGGEPVDKARYLLSDIVLVRDSDWKIVFGGVRPQFIPVIPPTGDFAALTSLDFVDISCGIGGASLGFHEAGFNPRFGVEPEEISSMLFERNCSTVEVYNEPVDSFLGRGELSEYQFTAVFVNCDMRDASTGAFVQSIRALKPAYAVCALSPDVGPEQLDNIEHEAMDLGYRFKSQLLDAADFGVAVHRRYLLVIASAPGREMPSFPVPQEKTRLTLKDVIEDLTWDNAKCRASDRGLSTSFSHTVNQPHGVTWHCTSCCVPDFSIWDPATTIADWDEPLPDVFALPSQNVKCRHPHHPERFLTVREMARILSFPDKCTFSGSLEKQYGQLASSIPPRFARAIAEEIRKVVSVANPNTTKSQRKQNLFALQSVNLI
ncbi:S-adenosyl-L-methionine-dependent methyltransferase [Hymenopellis radicata]|nr:S-adenosyl-L-methionine-dependent methyltransferase [Hymenopellis radicata]